MNQDHQSDYKKTIQKKSNISIEIPVWRKILYSIIAVVGIPILFFIILENRSTLDWLWLFHCFFFFQPRLMAKRPISPIGNSGWCFFPQKKPPGNHWIPL